MTRSLSVYQALHPPHQMDPFADPSWRDSDIPFSGIAQYPSISVNHYKPLDQDPVLTAFGGSGGGDLNTIYHSARQYESGVKDRDRQYTNCLKPPLSTMYSNIQNDENRVEALGLTSPSVSLSSNPQQHGAIDHAQHFHGHNFPSQMIATPESVTPMATSLTCSSCSSDCVPGVQMDQISDQVQVQQKLCGAFVNAPSSEGSYVVEVGSSSSSPPDMVLSADASEAQTAIMTHPLYPYLVAAHINCCKIGAESTDLEILGQALSNNQHLQPQNNSRPSAVTSPELDNVMAWYLRVLADLKEAMEEPFVREMEWCNEVFEKLKLLGPSSSPTEMTECQNRTGHKEGLASTVGQTREQSHAPSFDHTKGLTMDHMKEDKIVKEWLKTKHDRSQIYNLRGQCNKKRRQGKHPETARECLLEWFNRHGDWPYPTEEEKHKLAEKTKLEARQINNWFINQRKRHWESPILEETIQRVQEEPKSQRQFANIEKVFMDSVLLPLDALNTPSYTWSSTLT